MFTRSDLYAFAACRASRVPVVARRVLLLIAICAAVGGSVSAWAYWTAGASAGANGAAAAASVNQGATPTATAALGRVITVSWGASTLSSGRAVDGYIVKRYDAASGLPQTVLGGCAGTIATTACTEGDLPTGQWQYTVTPVIATNWRGLESLKSGTATIGPATLTLAKTVFGAPLPQNTTGSIAGYAANEGVSYRLDAATSLTGSPSAVNSSGSALITSLTLPTTSEGAHTVYALGSASPNASQASVGIVIDTLPPTTSALPTPAPNAAGWNNTAPVAVTLSANDGSGSGVAQIKYTTDGSDPTVSGTAQVYSAALSLNATTTVRYFASDNAGNASAVQTQLVRIDTVAPANVMSLSGVSGGASFSGTTVYYRGSVAGSFTLTNALTDTGSGPASSGTAALAGTSTGWSHTSSQVSTPASGPYVSNVFSWSAGTSSTPTESVVGSDVAANTSTTTLSFTNDTAAPSGGSVDATGLVGTGGRYSRSLALSVAFAKGADAASGIAPTGSQLLRASAPLTSAGGGTTDGTCGAYSAYAQVGVNDPISSVSDTVPSDNQCYRYEYVVPDNVGNVAAYTSPDIKVQSTTPASLTPTNALITPLTGPSAQFVSGSTVYYNPAQSGSFTVDSSASDARSGIAQLAFPALGGFAGGGNVTAPNTGTTFRTTYSWSNNPASPSPGAQSITATNNAAATATNATAFSVIKDATAPAGGSVDATGLVGTGARYSTSLALSIGFAKGADGGSGLAATGSQLLRASAPLTSDGTSNGACGAYSAYAQVGTNDPSSPKADNVPADHTCYRYEYLVPDNVGNLATYISPDIKVDTTVAGPTTPTFSFSGLTNAYWTGAGSTVYYGASAAGGAFTLTATSTDAFSGIASYAFPALGAGWTSTAGALGVNTYSWSAPNPAAPAANQPVTATNNVGRTSAAATFNAVSDVTPPASGTIAYTNGYQTVASVSVTFTPGTDAGSGVNAGSGMLQRSAAPLAGGTCGAFGAFATVASNPTSSYADASVSSGNCYQYRYLIADNVGNQATYVSASIVKIDTQGPVGALSLTSPLGAFLSGSTLYYKSNAAGSFKLLNTLTDAASGPASSTFPAIATAGWTHLTETVSTPAPGPYGSTTFSWAANPTNPVGYAVSGQDVAGNTANTPLTFISDTTAPATGSIAYTDGIVTVASVPITTNNGTDAQAGINAASGIIKRDQATLTTGTETCGAFAGTFATTVTLVGGADTTVTSGHCYQYEYLVSDNVGNQATYTSANVSKVDMSGPQVTAITSQQAGGGAGNGLMEIGDKLIITFSENLLPASVPTTVTGTQTRAGNQTAKLDIPGITNGAQDTGSSGYETKNTTATFNANVVLVNNGINTTVTITITSISGGPPLTSSGTLVFQVDQSGQNIQDAEGDSAVGTFTTANTFKLF